MDSQGDGEKLVSSLSPAFLRDAGFKLSMHIGKNYKDLASRFGYDCAEVHEFEMKDKVNPGLVLLQNWSIKSTATVAALHHHLLDLGRDDIIRLLEIQMKEPINFLVDIKRASDQTELFRDLLHTYGSLTVGGTIELCDVVIQNNISLKDLRCTSKLHGSHSVWERKASELRGGQLSFVWDDQGPAPFQNIHSSPPTHTPQISAQSSQDGPQHADYCTPTTVIPSRNKVKQLAENFRAPCKVTKSKSTVSLPDQPSQGGMLTPPNITKFASSESLFSQAKYSRPPVATITPMISEISESDTASTTSAASAAAAETVTKTRSSCQATERSEHRVQFSLSNETENQVCNQSINEELSQTTAKHLYVSPTPAAAVSASSPTVDVVEESWPRRSSGSSREESSFNIDLISDPQSNMIPDSTVLSDNQVESDYLVTVLPGFDVDEKIDGYHSEATSTNEVKRLMNPHLGKNGAYIIRPSRDDPGERSMSVIEHGTVVNYRIHKLAVDINAVIHDQYFLYENGPFFGSLSELVKFYECNHLEHTDISLTEAIK